MFCILLYMLFKQLAPFYTEIGLFNRNQHYHHHRNLLAAIIVIAHPPKMLTQLILFLCEICSRIRKRRHEVHPSIVVK